MTNDRYAAEQIVSAFTAEAATPSLDFELRLEGDRAREVCAWLEDEIEATLKSRTADHEAQARQIAALREALDRVVRMCGNPTIERCACGRPTGLPAIVACAGRALSSLPPSSMRLVPLERLREIEWGCGETCPVCGGLNPAPEIASGYLPRGHVPDCWLAAAIAGKEAE